MKTANQSLTRRALIAAACTLAFSASAWASDAYPNKVISLVVPTAAGGGNDAMARVLAKRMSCLLYTSPSPRDVEESRMPSSA